MLTHESSERLLYETLRVDHAELLATALLDRRVYDYIDGPPPTTVEDLAEEFTSRVAGPKGDRDEKWWNFAVHLNQGQYIGRVEATEHDGFAEVGYLFGSSHWGHGYATEALQWLEWRVRGAGFANSFWATSGPGNERSIRLLARVGYREVLSGWPSLWSYDDGDRVFVHRLNSN